MDAPDLKSLLKHFDEKITRVQQLIPWARTCNLLVQQQDARLDGQERTDVQLPDLHLLSDIIMDMEENIYEIDDHLTMERKRTERQKVRINNLITDLKLHLDYISSNFPVNFGKSPEKPKTSKYGIHAQRKTIVPPAKSVAAARPVNNAKSAVKSAATNRNGRPAAAGAAANKPVDCKPEPIPRKSVAAPSVLSGPALVVSKSSKPAIPVRMTKKFVTRFNHNVNKN